MIPSVAIVGKSGSGKTVVMERLIAEFKSRGYRVAAVKHAHATVELDTAGKDTWRFTQAGSDIVMVSSPSRITVFKNASSEPTIEEVLYTLADDCDIVLIEGFKRGKIPRIEVYDNKLGKELVCAETELSAVITNENLPYKLPQFRMEDTGPIADFIEKELLANLGVDLALFINGKQVFLKPFVKEIIANTLLAMVATLKNVGIIRHIAVLLRNRT